MKIQQLDLIKLWESRFVEIVWKMNYEVNPQAFLEQHLSRWKFYKALYNEFHFDDFKINAWFFIEHKQLCSIVWTTTELSYFNLSNERSKLHGLSTDPRRYFLIFLINFFFFIIYETFVRLSHTLMFIQRSEPE